MERIVKKYAAQVIGCRVNQYELQSMKTQLEKLGYEGVQEGEAADLCLIHTCAVTESAESSSRHAIRSLLGKHPHARVVVTGCLAQKDPASLRAIAESIEVMPGEISPSGIITTFEGHTRPFVKIQDGCSCFCSYCIVPYLRGPSRSRTREDILTEIKSLLDHSYQEIVITGVNVGDFSLEKYSLSDLLAEVDALPGLKRLRLSSINPNDIDEHFLCTVLDLNHFCPSLHLVLQSGSNAILRKMRRKYAREQFLHVVETIRSAYPDFAFSTDIIVGFPGESADDFELTVEIVRRVCFSKVHIFPFSPREGTSAARLGESVPIDVIKERKTLLAQIADECATTFRKKWIGQTVSVLTEKCDDTAWIFGLSPQGLSVKVPRRGLCENELINVKLIGFSGEDLLGEVVT